MACSGIAWGLSGYWAAQGPVLELGLMPHERVHPTRKCGINRAHNVSIELCGSLKYDRTLLPNSAAAPSRHRLVECLYRKGVLSSPTRAASIAALLITGDWADHPKRCHKTPRGLTPSLFAGSSRRSEARVGHRALHRRVAFLVWRRCIVRARHVTHLVLLHVCSAHSYSCPVFILR